MTRRKTVQVDPRNVFTPSTVLIAILVVLGAMGWHYRADVIRAAEITLGCVIALGVTLVILLESIQARAARQSTLKHQAILMELEEAEPEDAFAIADRVLRNATESDAKSATKWPNQSPDVNPAKPTIEKEDS